MLEPIRHLRLALDRTAFAAAVGFEELDPWQVDVLTTASRQILMNIHRQAGKTTVAALYSLHATIFEDPCLCIALAQNHDQSKELVRKIREMHSRLEGAPRLVMDSLTRVELENGSRCVALPGTGDSIRGYSAPKVIIIDEAARVAPDMIAAALPMQTRVVDPVLIAMSTPKGRHGWFFDQWHNSKGWYTQRLTAEENPRISREWLDQKRRELGETAYRTEFLCEFIDDNTSAFSSELIERCFRHDVRPLFAA